MFKGLFGRNKKEKQELQEQEKQAEELEEDFGELEIIHGEAKRIDVPEEAEMGTGNADEMPDGRSEKPEAEKTASNENVGAVLPDGESVNEKASDADEKQGSPARRICLENEPAMEETTFEVSGSDETTAEETVRPETEPSKPEKKGFFARLKEGLGKTRSAIADSIDNVLSSFKSVDEELFDELEEALIMADIGVDTSLYIIGELRKQAKEQKITEASALKQVLKNIIKEILVNQESAVDLTGSPAVIMVIGVNGVGKTTSIGKMANRYRQEGKKVLLAAADTFRAAAIDQLQIWADRADVDIVKHQEGSDPSAVVFDAIAAAKSRNADVVICDTAGRLHNKKNLMEELKKTARVIERETGKQANEVLLVLDASTGQNALVQAKEFAQVAGITGVILTKLDGTAKGGVVIALSREQNIGVKFIGVGEGIDDLQEFNPQEFAEALFPEEQ